MQDSSVRVQQPSYVLFEWVMMNIKYKLRRAMMVAVKFCGLNSGGCPVQAGGS